jgi:hypothetical protein
MEVQRGGGGMWHCKGNASVKQIRDEITRIMRDIIGGFLFRWKFSSTIYQ